MRYLWIMGTFMFLLSMHLSGQEKYELTVAQDGSGDYITIQAAIDACKAFPDSRVKVFIKNGIYHEKVKIPACNSKLSLIGENKEKTIISYNDYFDKINRGRNSTFYTYTLMVEADDFYADNLTIENTAGPVGQAVALHVEGNRCVFKNCNILGNQDTLYAAGNYSRQYFVDCYIEGTTDFIFGAATALFEHCTIFSKNDSYITAASTPKGKIFGFVFMNCKLSAAEGVKKVYLGRPWRDYAKVVFMNCELGPHILPDGWSNWDKTSRDKTAFYAEYRNNGPGSDTEKRIIWSHQLSKKESVLYTRDNILAPVQLEEPPIDKWL
jgi:pectinesterase